MYSGFPYGAGSVDPQFLHPFSTAYGAPNWGAPESSMLQGSSSQTMHRREGHLDTDHGQQYRQPPSYSFGADRNQRSQYYGNKRRSPPGASPPTSSNRGMGSAGLSNAGLGNAGFGNAGLGNAGFGNAGLGNAGFGNAGLGNANRPPAVKKPPPEPGKFCGTCNVEIPKIAWEGHLAGKKHKAKINALVQEQKKNEMHCALCNQNMPKANYEAHLSSKRHQKLVRKTEEDAQAAELARAHGLVPSAPAQPSSPVPAAQPNGQPTNQPIRTSSAPVPPGPANATGTSPAGDLGRLGKKRRRTLRKQMQAGLVITEGGAAHHVEEPAHDDEAKARQSKKSKPNAPVASTDTMGFRYRDDAPADNADVQLQILAVLEPPPLMEMGPDDLHHYRLQREAALEKLSQEALQVEEDLVAERICSLDAKEAAVLAELEDRRQVALASINSHFDQLRKNITHKKEVAIQQFTERRQESLASFQSDFSAALQKIRHGYEQLFQTCRANGSSPTSSPEIEEGLQDIRASEKILVQPYINLLSPVLSTRWPQTRDPRNPVLILKEVLAGRDWPDLWITTRSMQNGQRHEVTLMIGDRKLGSAIRPTAHMGLVAAANKALSVNFGLFGDFNAASKGQVPDYIQELLSSAQQVDTPMAEAGASADASSMPMAE
eukprot:CAMPEP_0196666970 /NCGR_PEP_ID=MMETSP1086-20130531/64818_1 /TAXON_ID=77921 /ORGANISM="Cyanoptyche  gloeocystis , Strain SAG4.97" /LENGTH=659 /DNA_ID=CAMNT_0042004237 /DNA_START=40 /DNA_END=2019 /DNA_ORIENTATION=+